jgi:hypothetical protein
VLGDHDVWAVGSAAKNVPGQVALILHWNGKDWTHVSNPSPATSYFGIKEYGLGAIAALSADDIWAVGTTRGPNANLALIEHWDGVSWRIVQSPASSDGAILRALAAVNSHDIWTIGINGTANQTQVSLHWDGRHWSYFPIAGHRLSGILDGVAAVSSGQVWAVGDSVLYSRHPLIVEWDGRHWRRAKTPNDPARPDNTLAGIAARSARDVWAVGSVGYASPLVEHFDGTRWTLVPTTHNGLPRGAMAGITLGKGGRLWTWGPPVSQLGPLFLAVGDGRHWNVLQPPFKGYIYDVVATSATVWLATFPPFYTASSQHPKPAVVTLSGDCWRTLLWTTALS